jgi:hypothetical protein
MEAPGFSAMMKMRMVAVGLAVTITGIFLTSPSLGAKKSQARKLPQKSHRQIQKKATPAPVDFFVSIAPGAPDPTFDPSVLEIKDPEELIRKHLITGIWLEEGMNTEHPGYARLRMRFPPIEGLQVTYTDPARHKTVTRPMDFEEPDLAAERKLDANGRVGSYPISLFYSPQNRHDLVVPMRIAIGDRAIVKKIRLRWSGTNMRS